MKHCLVDFKHIYYAYPDGTQAVHDATFQIHYGESVGLIGANGAGKSSILMLLAGILFPSKGEIWVGETLVTKETLPVIRQKIGFAFPDPDDQLFMTTVYDDVAFGPRNYGMDEQKVKKRVQKALDTVGAAHLKDRAPYKLSDGEKRAVAMATVLSMEPDLLVLDEPTAALDPRTRRKVIDLLKSFSQTIIIATHDLDMALELCSRTIVLSEGKVICNERTEKILTNEEILAQCALEMPLSLQGCPLCDPRKNKKRRSF